MKKSLIVLSFGFSLTAILVACGGDSGTKAAAGDTKSDTVSAASSSGLPSFITQAEYDKAVELAAGSDCAGCHQITTKTNGPAWNEIGKRYEPTEANIDTLASKIINGGGGNWGDVPMQPHPNFTKEEARTLAKYVLSLKNVK
ncbi:MAG TPA: c-type cytochrome [Chitinophagaceae bacterium]